MPEINPALDRIAILGPGFAQQINAMSWAQKLQQDEIGFGEEGNTLRAINADIHEWFHGAFKEVDKAMVERAESSLRNYYIAKLALITTEAAEAIEELRKNIPITETYYTVGGVHIPIPEAEKYRKAGNEPKPEGVPSELADIVIRCLSLAGETGIDLGQAVIEKLNYNATRAQKHGGKGI